MDTTQNEKLNKDLINKIYEKIKILNQTFKDEINDYQDLINMGFENGTVTEFIEKNTPVINAAESDYDGIYPNETLSIDSILYTYPYTQEEIDYLQNKYIQWIKDNTGRRIMDFEDKKEIILK